ncbi:hypothetical protein [Gemella morbillorum]
MTKEQAIEALKEHKEQIDKKYINTRNSKAIEIVLSMLEEKDKQIYKLKKHNDDLLRKLRNRVKDVKKLQKYSLYKKEFSRLNKQLQNKDKIIDLMAGDMAFDNEINSMEDIRTIKEQIKQYFENKAKEVK